MAEFDRINPLFERNYVPFDIIAIPNTTHGNKDHNSSSANIKESKRNGNYTVRILQGHRPARKGGGEERVIRFEMSDEYNLIDNSLQCPLYPREHARGTPSNNRGLQNPRQQQQQTPNVPIIEAPFMTSGRGRGYPMMQPHHEFHHGYDTSNTIYSQRNQSISTPNRPIELYELEVGESDFSDLRRDQALLVEFNDFANSLISLLQYCELGEEGANCMDETNNQANNAFRQNSSEADYYNNQYGAPSQYSADSGMDQGGWNSQTGFQNGPQGGNSSGICNTPSQPHRHPMHQQRQSMQHHGLRSPSPYGKMMPVSTYTCRLETDYIPSSDDAMRWRNGHISDGISSSMHARFSIVESNQFRELTHLALSLNSGTDKSVRLYLSSRLTQTLLQNRSVNMHLCEQKLRSEAAEIDLIGANKRMQELAHSSEAEKYEIRFQAEERIQSEHSTRIAEINQIKSTKDAEIEALNDLMQRSQTLFENKSRALEDINQKLNAEKMASESENESLATKLSIQETTNKSFTNEMNSLRSNFQLMSDEKATIEKSLHKLQLQLASLEHSNNSNEKRISQTDAQRVSAEKVSADAQQALSRQHAQLEDLRRRLSEAELESSRYKELTSRYQTNRAEMKKSIKEKVDVIREQEEVMIAREKEMTEWKHRMQGLEESLQRIREEKDDSIRELNNARRKMEDDAKKLENNQQVRDESCWHAHLNFAPCYMHDTHDGIFSIMLSHISLCIVNIR